MQFTNALKISDVPESTSWQRYKRYILPLIGIVLCSLVFHWLSGEAFLTPRNLSNLSRQVCVNLTLAVGMTLIILTSGIDLSVGSVLALSGMIAAITQVHLHWATLGVTGALLSFSVSVIAGAACGLVTGQLVSRFKITPFIVTLGMMVICRGMTLIISNAQAVAPIGESLGGLSADYLAPAPSLVLFSIVPMLVAAASIFGVFKKTLPLIHALERIFTSVALSVVGAYIFCGYRGIPYMVFISVACAILGIIGLKYTRFGRFIFAIGGNREAAELSGVPVAKTLLLTYMVMGVLAGLAGVMDVARVNGAVPSAGELAELDAIAAVVIGGTSLMGGQGSISGTLFGVLIMGILNNGMSLIGISEHYQKVFKGIVIIVAVFLDLRSKKKH